MKPITKDTPVGTRVLFRYDNRLTRGEYKGAADFDCLCRVWSGTRGELLVSRDEVYLDEPAPGGWAWACEQALNNQPTVRDRGRVKLEMVNDTLRLLVRYRDGWDYVDFGRDDLNATDWEIDE